MERDRFQTKVLNWMKVLQENGIGDYQRSSEAKSRDLFYLDPAWNIPNLLVRKPLPSDRRFIRSAFGKSSQEGLLICKPSDGLIARFPDTIREKCEKKRFNDKKDFEIAWSYLDDSIIDGIFKAILAQAQIPNLIVSVPIVPDTAETPSDHPPRIRLLPFGDVEFEGKESVFIQFLSEDLPNRVPCHFRFRKHSIADAEDTWALFQYHGKVWGVGLILFKKKEPTPDGIYKGYYEFAPDSIRIFPDPVTGEDLTRLCGCEVRMGQASNTVPLKSIDSLLKMVLEEKKSVRRPQLLEGTFYEGEQVETNIKAYMRNRQARMRCLEIHGYKCRICGLSFEETYGEIGKSYIQVHHLRPLAEGKKPTCVDPAIDLKPVCANCHAMLHRRTPPLGISELIEKMKKSHENIVENDM